MITKEVNEWIKDVECGMYSKEDAMYEFSKFAKYLTKEELIHIQNRLKTYLK
ncbi:hypothetical protein IJG72_05480 [bacterium]|nr:hypothetical protein [bacterium]